MDPKRIDWRVPLGGLLIAAALLALIWIARTENPDRGATRWPSQARTVQPIRTPEPLVPTPLPPARRTTIAQTGRTATPGSLARNATAPLATEMPVVELAAATPFPTVRVPALPTSASSLTATTRGRIGVGLARGAITDYAWDDHWPGWYLNWQVMPIPEQPAGVRFAQMVRLNNTQL